MKTSNPSESNFFRPFGSPLRLQRCHGELSTPIAQPLRLLGVGQLQVDLVD
jgi:hypothetical protein